MSRMPQPEPVTFAELNDDISYTMLKLLVLTSRVAAQRVLLKDVLMHALDYTEAEAEARLRECEAEAEKEVATMLKQTKLMDEAIPTGDFL
jgi:dihydroxyacetone kinase